MFKFSKFSSSPNHGGRPLTLSERFYTNIFYIHVSGHPRKGEYSGLTNDQKCKLRQEKLKEKTSDFMLKEKIERGNGEQISEKFP